jgi:soluble lytic murein transglycosylase
MAKICVLCAAVLVLFPVRLAPSEAREEPAGYDKIIGGIVTYLKNENGRLSEGQMSTIARHVYQESKGCRIDYRLILAVMKVESNFRHRAVSRKGAVGLLQIRPFVGKSVAKNIGMEWKGKDQLSEPAKNIRIGVYHLAGLIKDFTSLPSALNAYNRGAKRTRSVQKEKHSARYAGAVMEEYAKTLSLLPDSEEDRFRPSRISRPMLTDNR